MERLEGVIPAGGWGAFQTLERFEKLLRQCCARLFPTASPLFHDINTHWCGSAAGEPEFLQSSICICPSTSAGAEATSSGSAGLGLPPHSSRTDAGIVQQAAAACSPTAAIFILSLLPLTTGG